MSDMSVMTWTRSAKCGDCKYLKRNDYHSRRVYHTCDNPSSKHYDQRRTMKDLVCDMWKYIFE